MNTNFFKIAQLRVIDFLRTKNANAFLAALQSPLTLFPNPKIRIKSLMKLATYYPYSTVGQYAVSKATDLIKSSVPNMPTLDKTTLATSAIIKPFVNKNEPGFLMVSFEPQLDKLIKLKKFEEFASQYKIIFMPTWQPCYTATLSLLAARSPSSFFVMPSAFSEKTLCDSLSPNCNYLPFHAASWVRSDVYEKPSEQKDIDILMVANFSAYKRHWRLFEGIANLPSNIKVTLAGISWEGRTKDSLMREAKLFGVDDRIEIIEGASDHPDRREKGKPSIRQLLNRAKLVCAMTKREGSFIVVAEALMAGAPVAMYDNAIIGTKAYINDDTGILLNHKTPIGPQLEKILNQVDTLSPQAWAKTNISAEKNNKKLNTMLRKWSDNHNLHWSQNIEPFYCEHFAFQYFHGMSPEIEQEHIRIQQEFGLILE